MLCAALAIGPGALAGEPATTAGDAKPVGAHHPYHVAPASDLPLSEPMPDLARAFSRPYSGAKIDVTTYHYDNSRTGWNQTETDLTPAAVASSKFGMLAKLKVDGNVLAQPLLISGYVMPDNAVHDLLIVVTGHDSVYAYDANSYKVLWQVSMGTPQSSTDVGCFDVQPEYGIDSTPVIVRTAASAATLYLVAATEPSSGAFRHTLHALDLGTGKDLVTPVDIAPQATLADGSGLTFDPQNQWTRTGLAYNEGALYVGIGSHCDNNDTAISGWMLGYDSKLTLRHSFHAIQTASPGNLELASIWMTGFAPAIDSKGDIYVVTGNGDYTSHANDWGESALKLSPSLKVIGRFTDSRYASLNNGDTDFGSGGIMLLPPVSGQAAPPLAAAIGKSDTLFLLSQTNLGGLKPNEGGALQTQLANGNGVWGGPAYYAGPSGAVVYVQADSGPLTAYAVSTAAEPSLTPTVQGTTMAGYGGSLPIVSSNGAKAGTGVVWVIRRSNPVEFEAYDAVKLGAPLFTANVGVWSNLDNNNPFLTAMQANGRVYVPNYKTVSVFGLKK